MRQLRSNIDSSVATRRQRPLLVQRVWPLLQDERTKSASHQTKEKTGRNIIHNFRAALSLIQFRD